MKLWLVEEQEEITSESRRGSDSREGDGVVKVKEWDDKNGGDELVKMKVRRWKWRRGVGDIHKTGFLTSVHDLHWDSIFRVGQSNHKLIQKAF